MNSDNTVQGTIFKATGGFYYVLTEGGMLECRARGLFRKDGTTPYVGDKVIVQRNDDGSGTVDEILPRKNHLIRPPLANLDYMVVVLSVLDPEPNLLVADKFLAVLEYKGIEPLIAITKSDRQDCTELAALYTDAGFAVHTISSETGEGVDAFAAVLAGKFSAFSGNSGVGKSSLLNAIEPLLDIPVGITSKKLGRGKHTTRHVETFRLANGGLVADTPGFSTVEIVRLSDLDKHELAACFRDFAPYLGKCRFLDCAHTCEKGCAVLEAVQDGSIALSRHKSYLQIYHDVKDIKEWERR